MPQAFETSTPPEFRAAPLDQAIHTIRTWTEASWPIDWEEAALLMDQLGWINSPSEKGVISTSFGFKPHNGSMAGVRGYLWSLGYQLTDAPYTQGTEFTQAANNAFNQYLQPLRRLYGEPSLDKHRGITAAEWTLDNGVGLTLGVGRRLVQVSIESPEYHAIDGLDDEDDE